VPELPAFFMRPIPLYSSYFLLLTSYFLLLTSYFLLSRFCRFNFPLTRDKICQKRREQSADIADSLHKKIGSHLHIAACDLLRDLNCSNALLTDVEVSPSNLYNE